jgi:hypothetical protein
MNACHVRVCLYQRRLVPDVSKRGVFPHGAAHQTDDKLSLYNDVTHDYDDGHILVHNCFN